MLMTHSSPSGGQVSNLSQQQQQLPPACGARQLSKLKRFLTTLQQFGADISPGIGDHVRELVLALVVRLLSVFLFPSKNQWLKERVLLSKRTQEAAKNASLKPSLSYFSFSFLLR